jgi:subtilisin family serine protease
MSCAVLVFLFGALTVPAQAESSSRQRYIVVLHNSAGDPGDVASEHGRSHRAEVSQVYRYALKGYAAVMSPQAATSISRDPRVDFVEADQQASAFAQNTPTGIRRAFATSNANIGIDANDDVRVDVDVAVLDSGIDFDHPDLNVVARTNCATGGPNNKNCTDNDGDDGNGHGTHVAGTIGAIDNGIGVVGMAPGARLHAVRVLDNNGSGYISWIVAGIDWVTARSGQIEVANMSLGCACSSASMDQAIARSVDAGVVYAVAAGNDDKDASGFSPANHPDVITVSALADFDGLAGGGAAPTCRTDEDDTLANFSNWGSLIEIAAPGVCILSTWKGGTYNTISGTSMASPHVAGAAALLASGTNDPANETDVFAIRDTLMQTGNLDWTDDSGDGIKEPLLDVRNALVYAPAMVSTGGGGTTNSPPVANDDSISTTVDTPVAIAVLANDTDANGDALNVTNLTQPANGSAVLNPDGTVTYTPATGYAGTDSFTYTANDGVIDSNVASVSIAIDSTSTTAWDLVVAGAKRKGTKTSSLAWQTTASTAALVDVYRDGVYITTTANDGAHSESLGKGGATYVYRLCEAGATANCSNDATVTF